MDFWSFHNFFKHLDLSLIKIFVDIFKNHANLHFFENIANRQEFLFRHFTLLYISVRKKGKLSQRKVEMINLVPDNFFLKFLNCGSQ